MVLTDKVFRVSYFRTVALTEDDIVLYLEPRKICGCYSKKQAQTVQKNTCHISCSTEAVYSYP